MPDRLIEHFSQLSECQFLKDCNLKDYTTLRLNVMAPLLIVSSVDSLQSCVRMLTGENVRYSILGKGSNVICSSEEVVYLTLDLPFDKKNLTHLESSYILPASFPISLLTSAAMKLGIGGWEVFTGIPATLGGSVFMNAGTNLGEIGPLIKRVWAVTKYGELKEYTLSEKDFSYRQNHFLSEDEVIYQVEITHKGYDPAQKERIQSYLRARKESQPLDKATCGCVFKNVKAPETCLAGKFIDIMGLGGLCGNSLKISHKHSNFIEHGGSATDKDFKNLVSFIQSELYLNYGVYFETEFIELGRLNGK